MQLITRTPTRHYFVTMFVVVSALFFTMSVVIYRNYAQAQKINQQTLYDYEVARKSRKILFDLVGMETGVRGYMLTGRAVFLEPHEGARDSLNKQMAELEDFTKHDPITQGHMKAWLSKIGEFSQTLNEQIERAHVSDERAIQESLIQQKAQMDALRTSVEEFIQKHLEALQQKIYASHEASADFKYILVIGTTAAIGGMLLATLVILALIDRSKRSERETREMEERFLTIMMGVNDGLYDRNMNNDEIYYSPSYKSMLGYTDDEFPNTLSMTIDNIHPDDLAKAQDVLVAYLKGETPTYTSVFRMLHKGGEWVWILSRGVGLRAADGRITRIIGTHTNITEQKKREEELIAVNAEMESFTYITSHDLRTPLVNLKGFASEMSHAIKRMMPILQHAEAKFTPEEQKIIKESFEQDIPESLRFIAQSVDKMDALTTALLDLSRIGKREYRLANVDMQALVKRCLDTMAYEIAQKKITVRCEPLPAIQSDSLALEQVFSNVLDNAIKYLEPERAGEITIAARSVGTELIFSISDNGRGIVAEDRDKVFQIFRRARNSSNVRGIGMGMAFVQATVRRLGGSIWFTSEVGKGTTFFIRLNKNPVTKGNQV